MERIRIAFVVFMGSMLLACNPQTYADLEGEEIVIEENVTYNEHVKSIIDNNCIICHSPGNSASHRLFTNYELVKDAVLNTDLLDRIQRQNGEPGQMPQTGRMAQSQINIILQWVDDGLLEF